MSQRKIEISQLSAEDALATIQSSTQQARARFQTPWWFCILMAALMAIQWYCAVVEDALIADVNGLGTIRLLASTVLILGMICGFIIMRKRGFKSRFSVLPPFEKVSYIGILLAVFLCYPIALGMVRDVNSHWPAFVFAAIVFSLWTYLMRRFPLA